MALEVGDFWNEAFVGTLINVKSWGGGGGKVQVTMKFDTEIIPVD